MALCVTALPLGVVSVNITLAPEVGAPPLLTDTVMGTVLGRVKLVPDTERLTANDCGVTTVALAAPVALADVFDAFMVTA